MFICLQKCANEHEASGSVHTFIPSLVTHRLWQLGLRCLGSCSALIGAGASPCYSGCTLFTFNLLWWCTLMLKGHHWIYRWWCEHASAARVDPFPALWLLFVLHGVSLSWCTVLLNMMELFHFWTLVSMATQSQGITSRHLDGHWMDLYLESRLCEGDKEKLDHSVSIQLAFNLWMAHFSANMRITQAFPYNLYLYRFNSWIAGQLDGLKEWN